ncbi:hypothetical protein HAX54_052409 [Datura stramonium]|uniref:Uncharacterized protein n=1 Tax=Datura stramonium TaxID=4076 RepID=A0ABS8RRV4_DATST|nr:hypothetical protein [Datura stramonium]
MKKGLVKGRTSVESGMRGRGPDQLPKGATSHRPHPSALGAVERLTIGALGSVPPFMTDLRVISCDDACQGRDDVALRSGMPSVRDEDGVPGPHIPHLQLSPYIFSTYCTDALSGVLHYLPTGHQVPVMPPKVGCDKLGIRAGRIPVSLQAVLSRVLSKNVLCTTFYRQEAARHDRMVTLSSSSVVL